MPEFELSPGAKMFYRDDDFTDPWRTSEAVLMLHGNSENGAAWNGWMPVLGRRFRVVRPDMRGFGQSTPMPANHPWTLDGIIDDFMRLADYLGIERFHLVGAKIGGGIALRLAEVHPDRLLSLTVSGARTRGREARGGNPKTRAEIERDGVLSYARWTMAGRLGNASPEMIEGWIQMMGKTATSTALGFIDNLHAVDVTPDLWRITCPVLAITPKSREGQKPLEQTQEWLKQVKRGELLVIDSESYHLAATHPEECAKAMVDFIDRNAVPA